MMTIADWLNNIKIKRLDAELLLMHVLVKPREWILAHTEFELDEKLLKQLNNLTSKVLQNTPLAHILGYKEFYGRNFVVSPATLIPRPETESLVEITNDIIAPDLRIIDVGCGSGCIGITLKLEHPKTTVILSDISEQALIVAKQNATRLEADVELVISDLFESINSKFDIIVANLPYVDRSWNVSPSTKYEPKNALFAGDSGLELIKRLLVEAPRNLSTNGYIALEADARQHKNIIKFAREHNYQLLNKQSLALLFQYKN